MQTPVCFCEGVWIRDIRPCLSLYFRELINYDNPDFKVNGQCICQGKIQFANEWLIFKNL